MLNVTTLGAVLSLSTLAASRDGEGQKEDSVMGKTMRKVRGKTLRENDAPRKVRDGGCQTLTPPTREALAMGAARFAALTAKAGAR